MFSDHGALDPGASYFLWYALILIPGKFRRKQIMQNDHQREQFPTNVLEGHNVQHNTVPFCKIPRQNQRNKKRPRSIDHNSKYNYSFARTMQEDLISTVIIFVHTNQGELKSLKKLQKMIPGPAHKNHFNVTMSTLLCP